MIDSVPRGSFACLACLSMSKVCVLDIAQLLKASRVAWCDRAAGLWNVDLIYLVLHSLQFRCKGGERQGGGPNRSQQVASSGRRADHPKIDAVKPMAC